MSTLPCWSIVVPGHPDEVEQALAAAFEHSGPVYIRLSELANAQPHDIDHPVDIRRPERGYPTVIAVGPMLDRVLDAVGDDGFGIVYLATLRPFPADPLADLLAGGDVVVAEPYLAGTTLGDLVGAIGDSGARLEAIGVRRAESRRYGAIEDHTAWHGLDPPGLRRRLRETATRWQRAAIA